MPFEIDDGFTSFAGHRQVATGNAAGVAAASAAAEAAGETVLIFDNRTGRPADLDYRHNPPIIFGAPPAPGAGSPGPSRGRPRLGVTAREVTLLPRHWQWLEAQAGGASAALRRLVDQARKDSEGAERAAQAQAALYAVMSALAGDLSGFEAAARALYAQDDTAFDQIVETWPQDVAGYIGRLAAAERYARRIARALSPGS